VREAHVGRQARCGAVVPTMIVARQPPLHVPIVVPCVAPIGVPIVVPCVVPCVVAVVGAIVVVVVAAPRTARAADGAEI